MFLICLTHDIEALDHPFWSQRGILRGLQNGRTRKIALDYLRGNSAATQNPFDTFDTILEMERNHGATSTFFSLPFASSRNLYRLKELGDQAEIGLHGMGESFRLLSALKQQKATLESTIGRSVTGIRMHMLSLAIPRTFDFEKQAGLTYDATYLPPRFGQKRIYHPFLAVDGLLEIPLSVTDSDYGEMGPEKTWERIEAVLDEHRKNEGVCTILWHPHSFYDEKCAFHRLQYKHLEGFKDVYERILQYGENHADEMCSCIRVAEKLKDTSTVEKYW